MDIINYELQEQNLLLKKYVVRINFCRMIVYTAIACLYIIYAAPLFKGYTPTMNTEGESMNSTILSNRIWIQFVLVSCCLVVNIFSHKKPFIAFLILTIALLFIAFIFSLMYAVFMDYIPQDRPALKSVNYLTLIGQYIMCALLVWGTLTAKKYEQIKLLLQKQQ